VAGDLFPTTRNAVNGTASHAPKNVATRLVQPAANFTTKGELLVAIDKQTRSESGQPNQVRVTRGIG
jgi:hypothetical protein